MFFNTSLLTEMPKIEHQVDPPQDDDNDPETIPEKMNLYNLLLRVWQLVPNSDVTWVSLNVNHKLSSLHLFCVQISLLSPGYDTPYNYLQCRFNYQLPRKEYLKRKFRWGQVPCLMEKHSTSFKVRWRDWITHNRSSLTKLIRRS